MIMSDLVLLPLSNQRTAIAGHSLYDYLQADKRPTFLIALSASDGSGPSIDSSLILYNAALSVDNGLLHKISCVIRNVLPHKEENEDEADDGEENQGEQCDFASWMLCGTSSMWFSNLLWSASDIDARWRVVSGIYAPQSMFATSFTTKNLNELRPDAISNPTKMRATNQNSMPSPSADPKSVQTEPEARSIQHSGTLLSSVAKPSSLQHQVQTFDWANTVLGPIETWPHSLYHAVKHALSSPLAEFVYWGPSRNAIWNDAASTSLRGFQDVTLGFSAIQLFGSFWNDLYESVCQEVEQKGSAITPCRAPGPLIERDGGFRETFWTYNYIPILEDNGVACGIHAVIQDVTIEALMEGRIETLLNVNEAMGTAKDLASFWKVIIAELEKNAADIPLAAVYSIGKDAIIDSFADVETQQQRQKSSGATFRNDTGLSRRWVLEGSIGFPEKHICVPSEMELDDTRGLSPAFQRVMTAPTVDDILLCTENGTLRADLLVGCEDRGLGFECTQLIIYPFQRPFGGVVAWLVLGINPRRTFDEEYRRFTRLLSRHIESKLVLILTLEREKKVAVQIAAEAAYQQQKMSVQLQQQRRKIEQSETRFFRFAEQAPIGVFVIGSEGQLVFCNDTYRRILGISPENVDPKPWLPCTHPEDVDRLEHAWKTCVTGIAQNNFEWRLLRPGSKSFASEDDILYVESCWLPEMAEDGTFKSVTGITADVSIPKAYQRAQAEKLETALEARRIQEYFMDMVSHEMRNPLNAIIQCAEETSQLIGILKSKTSGEETSAVLQDAGGLVDTILYCGTHQKQLINDVLTLSKLDSRLLLVHPTGTHPNALLHQAVSIYTSEMRTLEIKVFTSSEIPMNGDGEEFSIMADPSRILQILINLIGNALKFMKGREKRELHINVYTSVKQRCDETIHYIPSGQNRADPTTEAEWGTGEPVHLYFSVRDTGPGLSESEISSLFTRFQQASPRTHVTYGGSGLGLFISRELAELHGGEIGISSKVDQGSTFVFYVKGRRLVSQSAATEQKRLLVSSTQHSKDEYGVNHTIPTTIQSSDPNSSTQHHPPSALHVLVVEDNDVNRRVLKRQLQKLGYKVTEAIHGGEALSIMKTSTWWLGDSTEGEEDTRPSSTNDSKLHLSIILCDLEMPVMNGVTCVRHIRKWQQEGLLHSNIPVMAVTGNARAERSLLGDGSEFDHVISKPYSFPNLVEQMGNLVNRSVESPI